jgi:hypothetical protein
MKKVVRLLVGLMFVVGMASAQTTLSMWYHGAGKA